MVNILDEVSKLVRESMMDAGVIASSAIRLTANRSHELGMNPIITLMLLRELCTANIESKFEELLVDPKLQLMGKLMGRDSKKEMEEVMKLMEELVKRMTKQKGIIDRVKL